MKHRPLGFSREAVSVIGQGTWNLERGPREKAVAALRAGLDAGMSMIDTAEMYGEGAVERIVGEAIAGRRDEVFLVTKVLPSNASRRGTIAACERSLARLGTDRIDVYLLHWPGSHPIADTIAAFEELRQKGKIRYWGLSNFDTRELDEALAVAGPRGIVANQVLYHLEERAIEHAVLPWCERHDVALQAYSPFGSGEFPSPSSAGGRVLAAIARAHGATPHQIALSFLIRNPAVFAIPKAASREHAVENARAAEIVLSEEDVRRIEQAFPLGRAPSHLPTL
ncbi:Oxidoreductase, aldo/keto reductase family protein [Minicystis rosea]|nr:Oxidoreductase, aldo/keto reductase family protein [Minicystis rosea]